MEEGCQEVFVLLMAVLHDWHQVKERLRKRGGVSKLDQLQARCSKTKGTVYVPVHLINTLTSSLV